MEATPSGFDEPCFACPGELTGDGTWLNMSFALRLLRCRAPLFSVLLPLRLPPALLLLLPLVVMLLLLLLAEVTALLLVPLEVVLVLPSEGVPVLMGPACFPAGARPMAICTVTALVAACDSSCCECLGT